MFLLDEAVGSRTRLTGKRALFEQLKADGVTDIFGNPGTTEQGFMDVLQDYPDITYYLALHEGVAIGMADAYARATRKPAFVELHIAPGLGNAMGTLYNARVGHSPLVVYAGQSPTAALFQEPYLSGDLVAMAQPLAKWAAEITQPGDVPQALRRAFKVAEEPPQGPVVLSLPIDVLDGEADMLITPTALVQWRGRPPQGAVEDAAEMLVQARAPAILIGNHVGLSDAQQAVVALAELLGAPIFSAFTNSVNIPAGHPLYQHRGIQLDPTSMRRALAPHDLLLVVGAPLLPSIFPDAQGPVPERIQVIQVDYDSWELGKNHPADLLVRADPRETMVALQEEILHRSDALRLRRWQDRRVSIERATLVARERVRRQHLLTWDALPIAPHRLMAEIAAALPPDAAIFEESGTSGVGLDLYLQPSERWRWFGSRGGGIGGGLPGALGLQVAFPDRPVVGVVTDGASLFSITGLWTAAHHRLPVTYVVCNNRSYRRLKQNLVEYRQPDDMDRPFAHMDLTSPELGFDRIAEAFGVPGQRIEQPEQIAPALRDAIDSDGPVLLDVVIEGTP